MGRKNVRRRRHRVLVKFVQCKAVIVRETTRLVGWRECKPGDDNWDVAWGDTTAALFRGVQQLKPFQRVNHFPLMQIICRKDLLAQHLQTIRQLCPNHLKEFCFFPETWVLPGDVQRFWAFVRQSLERHPKDEKLCRGRSKSRNRRSLTRGERGTSADTSDEEEEDQVLTFIAKPRAAARGNGIFLFQVRPADLRAPRARLKEVLDSEKMVVQSFLSKPLLIDGYKWDMRVYVLVTNVHPLTVYLYTDGLARFCTDLYEAPEEENLEMREMHLTNFSINWESDAFEDTEDGGTGSKRSLRTVLESSVEDGDNIWLQIAECVKKTLLAIGPKMQDNYDRYFGRSRDGGGSACFELLGFDFILDEEQRLFLLEVNSAPSLSTPTNLDEEIKECVLMEGFGLLGLDGSEKAKHLERQQQRLAERHNEHLARREELTRQKEDHLRSSVGFLSSLGQKKLPQISSARSVQRPPEDTSPARAETEPSRVKSIPGFVSFLEDSDDEEETQTSSEESEEGSTDEDEESEGEEEEELCEDFRFLGTPVSKNYVQILPASENAEGIWQEIHVGAERLAQGWTAVRPQSQPPRSSPISQGPRSSSRPARPSLKMVLQGPKKNPLTQPRMLLQMKSKEIREVFPLKTIQLGI